MSARRGAWTASPGIPDSIRRAGRLLWIAGLIASCAAPEALAQAPNEPVRTAPPFASAAAPPRSRIWKNGIGGGFRTGATQAGFFLDAGFGVEALGSTKRHNLRLATLRFGQTLGANWELLGELFGGVQIHPTHRSLFGLTPVIRYNFATGSRWVPFLELGAGPTYTNIRDGDLSTAFEFNDQIGAGVHYFFRQDRALTLEYRWFHLSNGGINSPNKGLNTQVLSAGLSWFFGSSHG